MSARVPSQPTPPATDPRPWKWSRKQYYRLGELGFFDGHRVELIRGEIVELSPRNWPHVVACRKVAEVLEKVFTGLAWIAKQEPVDLTESDPEPDVSVIAGRFEDYVDHPTTALLIVEVADTSLFYDTTTKAGLYAEKGVPEYWALDLTNRRLLVFRDPAPIAAGGASYRTQLTLSSNESVTPLAVPAASVAVAELLP
jgi:Uma2 family endonuclease